MTNISYIFLIVFLITSFLGATPHTIVLIAGLIFWLLSKNFYNPNLKVLNFLVLAQILANLVLFFIHPSVNPEVNRSFLEFLTSNLTSYLPWFWFTGTLYKLDETKSRLAQLIFSLAGGLISIVILLQAFGLVASREAGYGIISQPFTTAGVLLIAFFISLALIDRTKSSTDETSSLLNANLAFLTSKKALYTLIFLQAIGLILLSQRSIWLALVVGLLIYLVTSSLTQAREVKISSLLKGLIGLGSIAGIAYLISDKFKKTLAKLPKILEGKAGLGCRIEIWKNNWNEFLAHPLFGMHYAKPTACFKQTLEHAHNIYLNQLVSKGLFGFLIWISFLGYIFYKLIINLRYGTAAYLAGLTAICIEGLFEHWWGDSEVLSVFFFLIAISSLIKNKQKDSGSI